MRQEPHGGCGRRHGETHRQKHRQGAPCRPHRCAKDTGLRNLPLHGFNQNQLWCEIVALACDLLAWMQMLALTGEARRWEPRRLRLRLFTCAGRIVRGSRRLKPRLAASWPWTAEITTSQITLGEVRRLLAHLITTIPGRAAAWACPAGTAATSTAP